MKILPQVRAQQRVVVLVIALLSAAAIADATTADIPQNQTRPQGASARHDVELAAAYLTGHGVPQDDKQAAYWYEKAAELGDPDAEKEIGYFYQIGFGVQLDPVRAVHWYQLADAAGLVSAKVNLGVAYVWGVGVRRDLDLARQLFLQAAAKGNGLAACYLGNMYSEGIGVKEDVKTAEHWFETGTKMHDPQAAFRLGALLFADPRHTRDLPRAADAFRKSANAGYVPAMQALGLLLMNTPTLATSSAEADGWLEKAAQAGNWRATTIVGVQARDGHNRPVDLKKAYYSFKLAALEGGSVAANLVAGDLRRLSVKLGDNTTAALDSEADAWFQQHKIPLEFIYKDGENWRRFPAFALGTPEGSLHAGMLIPTHSSLLVHERADVGVEEAVAP